VNALLRGIWEFVVGDDWTLALGVALVLALTALIAAAGLPAWWVALVLVPLCLLGSVLREVRRSP
jgi:hypothetical protein